MTICSRSLKLRLNIDGSAGLERPIVSESEQTFLLPRARRSPPERSIYRAHWYVMRCLLLACASSLPGRIKFHCRGNVSNL